MAISKESKDDGIVKSWFTLAEIFGVISGLFMIATGFLFISPSEQPRVYLDSLSLCEKVINSELNNIENYTLKSCLKDYGDYFSKKINTFNSYASFFFGQVFYVS